MSQRDQVPQLDARLHQAIRPGKVTRLSLQEDGTFPNNGRLPLLAYQGVLDLPQGDPAALFEALLATNGWGSSWRNGVYGFHHYHSTAHEVLGIYAGSARVLFGGEKGTVLSVGAGDVVVIPAGVAHKNLGASGDFRVVGAYPHGQRPDMNYGKPDERPRTDRNIAQVPLPARDPVYGGSGSLLELWDRYGGVKTP